MSVPSTMATDGDRQAAFCATVADEWVRNGVTHVVVCPGSRSTPLTVAVAAHPGLKVHVRLDERSAGFTALGIGLATGMPAIVVVTSGTAAAELHPAVVEADLAGVPLVVCTADRPPELQDVGAPQTTDQERLFGTSVRWFCNPGIPSDAARDTWRSTACRSVAEARGGTAAPGPVHLNLPFREPLLGRAESAGGPVPGREGGMAWHRVSVATSVPDQETVAQLLEGPLSRGRHGVIVAGSGCGEPGALFEVADQLGWPVLADPRSGARLNRSGVIAAADGLLRSAAFAEGHRPDVVLRLGGPWASKVVEGHFAHAETVIVEPWGRWPDPRRTASWMVRSDPTAFCHTLKRALSGRPSTADSDHWRQGWTVAETAAQAALEAGLCGDQAMDEPSLARRLMAALPADGQLVVSSSMPVRDVEAYGAPSAEPIRVYANRGANGIDGVVSTALGVALAAGPGGGHTVALVGDLAFLHDISSLVGPEGDRPKLVVVVADNDGGGIFSFLPQAEALDADVFDPLFGTPQGHDIAEVARGLGWPVELVDDADRGAAFDAALNRAQQRDGGTVLVVKLPGRQENVDRHDRTAALVAEAVEATLDR